LRDVLVSFIDYGSEMLGSPAVSLIITKKLKVMGRTLRARELAREGARKKVKPYLFCSFVHPALFFITFCGLLCRLLHPDSFVDMQHPEVWC
jgi:hypothetical protein